MPDRRITTKDVALLRQLSHEGQLLLSTEFQRNAVWPAAAKAYLVDTILADRPIPLLFLQRGTSAQNSRLAYTVIDGQQRLRAVFEFLDGRVRLTQSDNARWRGRRFDELSTEDQFRVLNYDFVCEELSGYSDSDIRDLFVRINKYVVNLAPQELRHARVKGIGAFGKFVEALGGWEFWRQHRVFTPLQVRRMRQVEFAAELLILLIEGVQDKKAAIDLYYEKYFDAFPEGKDTETILKRHTDWILRALPSLASTRFRKPVDLYGLLGALDRHSVRSGSLTRLNAQRSGVALLRFDRETRANRPPRQATRYLAAASRQTDNIIPRTTRIEILEEVLANA